MNQQDIKRKRLWLRLFFILLVTGQSATVLGETQDNRLRIQEQYVAFYGRPGDPAGVTYWVGRLAQENSLDAIQADFAASEEYRTRIIPEGVTSTSELTEQQASTLINGLYNNLFGRDGEPEGITFWTSELLSGRRNLIDIATAIGDGAPTGSDDRTVFENRRDLAERITQKLEADQVPYGNSDIDIVRNFLFSTIKSATDRASDSALEPLFDILTANIPQKTVSIDSVSPLQIPDTNGPIQTGCGDYRLLVTMTTDAESAGAQVTGPANEVDVVWNYSGPGLGENALSNARLYNEDNRGAFGIENNTAHETVSASFILLISGVSASEMLALDLGRTNPSTDSLTTITIENTPQGMDSDKRTMLAEFQVQSERETVQLDLCSATPMTTGERHAVDAKGEPLPPRTIAFYYSWWGTTAGPDCANDASGWVRENGDFATPHSPLSSDNGTTIYENTSCWMTWSDGARTGQLYDVTDVDFLGEQMVLAKAGGVDAFAVSVHGDNTYEMDFLQNKALPLASKTNYQIAALYEAPESGWTGDFQQDAALVGSQLATLLRVADRFDQYMTVSTEDTRKVIFIDAAVLAHLTSASDWSTIRELLDQTQIPYFLFAGPTQLTQVYNGYFDGMFNDLDVIETYEIPLSLSPYALRNERRLAYRAAGWMANEKQMPMALPVVTGWDTEIVRPGDSAVIARNYGATEEGHYYRVRWEDATEAQPDWIVITSWNEWAEGTELEPSDKFPPSTFDFLGATKRFACDWKAATCQ